METLKQDNANKQKRIEKIEQEQQCQQCSIRNLDIKTDDFEQQRYASHLQVVGMSEHDGKDDVKNFIKLSREKLGIKIKPSEIEEVTRLGRKGNKARHLIVKFQSKETKEKVQSERKKLITQSDAAANIYLNDRLTKHRQNVLFAARKLVRGKRLFAA